MAADEAPPPTDAPDPETETEATDPEPTRLHGAPVLERFGQREVFVDRDELVDLARALRDDGWLMCLDVCGVDYLANPHRVLPEGVVAERFEVVVHLISHRDRARVRLRIQVPENDAVVPSLYEIYPGADAHEREVFDLFGIVFDGHPDLTRILMPEDWTGHPLRKDYAVGVIPVQFKAPGDPTEVRR